MEKMIDLNLIEANPWQPRMTEDAEHIANLAASIAEDGLMQVPTARMVGDASDGTERVQLAFGHSRLAAYRLLRDIQHWLTERTPIDFEDDSPKARAVAAADRALELGTSFDEMPVHILEIDDESMYRFAISENIQRRDLSQIETAKAMLRYKTEFGKKSADIGALFGVNEATVRGTIRLLELPDALQEKLSNGEMTVGDARKILSVRHLVPQSDLSKMIEDRTSGRTLTEIVNSTIENGGLSLITMWSRWSSGAPRGGDSLWPLSWTYKTPPYSMPTEKEFTKLWTGPAEIRNRSVENWAREFATSFWSLQPHQRRTWEQLYAENHADLHPVLDLLKQLAEPPACTSCTYYLKNDGNHLCSLKACWNRKFERWVETELQKLSKKLDIKTYSSTRDGRAFTKLSKYNDRDKKWVSDKHAGLRLMIKKQSWNHDITDSQYVCLVMTGPEAEKAKAAEAEKKEQESRESYTARLERDRRKNDAYQNAVKAFVLEQVCPLFASALDGKLSEGLLAALASQSGFHLPDDMPASRKVIWGLVWRRSEVDGHARQSNHPTPVQFAAKHLKGVAQAWGVKLPPDWMDIAARYEPDLSEFPECCAVSTETDETESAPA
jgi:ParB-like chromosome segregation protein Spo0J